MHPQHGLHYRYFSAECLAIHICTGCSTGEKHNAAQAGGTSQIARFLLLLYWERVSKFRLRRTIHISWHCSRIFETTSGAVCAQLVFLSFSSALTCLGTSWKHNSKDSDLTMCLQQLLIKARTLMSMSNS